MFDIGWSEILLIGGVAVVVLKPKDLPDAMRSVGKTVTKLRRMAGEFQGQFNQALRDANLEDVKKEFDSIRQATSAVTGGLSPASLVGNQIKNAIMAPSSATAAVPTSMIDPALTSSAPVTPRPAEPAALGSGTVMAEEAEVDIPSAFALSAAFRRS
jgi:sec-independent protein translocase protein TatB